MPVAYHPAAHYQPPHTCSQPALQGQAGLKQAHGYLGPWNPPGPLSNPPLKYRSSKSRVLDLSWTPADVSVMHSPSVCMHHTKGHCHYPTTTPKDLRHQCCTVRTELLVMEVSDDP